MDQIKTLYEASGYPGAARLYALAKAKGITGFTQQQVKTFVEGQTVSQLHKRAPVVQETPITTSGKMVQMQMDLLDLSAYSRSNEGKRWCLVLEDIWDRRAVAVPLQTKSPEHVQPALVEAFKEIGGKPVQLVSDSGTEWMGKVKSYLDAEGIKHRTVEVGDHHSLGIIDSFARFMKNSIHKHFTHTQETDWIHYLPQLIRMYNETPHGGLKPKGQPAMSPNEASHFETDTRNLHVAKVQAAHGKKRPSGLYVGDHVRVMKRKQVFSRGYEVRYSTQVYTIEKVDGHWYILNDGRRFREGDLQKVPKPKESQEEEKKDVAQAEKFEHRTEQMLKHQEGVEQANRREGLRERRPQSQLIHRLFGNVNW